MRRRKFLMLLGGAVVGCPLTARAQQASKRPTVAYMFLSPSVDGQAEGQSLDRADQDSLDTVSATLVARADKVIE
jgi:hypothetical protein